MHLAVVHHACQEPRETFLTSNLIRIPLKEMHVVEKHHRENVALKINSILMTQPKKPQNFCLLLKKKDGDFSTRNRFFYFYRVKLIYIKCIHKTQLNIFNGFESCISASFVFVSAKLCKRHPACEKSLVFMLVISFFFGVFYFLL